MDDSTRQALREASLCLESTARGADLSAISPLDEQLAEKRLVGLGRPESDAEAAVNLQERILRYLVTAGGLRVIGVDADYATVKALDAYVVGETGERDGDLPEISSSWPVGDLVEWLRTVNADRQPANRVHLYGLGARDPAAVVSELGSYFDRVDSPFLETVRHNLTRISDLSPEGSPSTVAEVVADEGTDRDNLLEAIDRLLPSVRDRLNTHQEQYVSTAGRVAWEEATHCVTLLEQAAAVHRPLAHLAEGEIDRETAIRRSWHLGALAMADNVDWILGAEAAESMAILSRNEFLARAEQDVPGTDSDAQLLGLLLDSRYGNAYYALGSAVENAAPGGRDGSIDYGNGTVTEDPDSGTVPSALSSLESPAVVLDFDTGRAADDRLSAWLADDDLVNSFDGYSVATDTVSETQ